MMLSTSKYLCQYLTSEKTSSQEQHDWWSGLNQYDIHEQRCSERKIKEFFEKEGTIGGGYTPKHLSYLNELEAAEEFKENLISLGISDVIFTNKDGIDIMGEDTWMTLPPTKKKGKRRPKGNSQKRSYVNH